MEKDKLLTLIMSVVECEKDKQRLSCEKAHRLSREYNVPLIEIGKLCNEKNIRIRNCQLGCF